MAKLKAPLLSLGATQQIGKSLVFFPWKGLNAVREYVVPTNPKTAGQTTQRGYLTASVSLIHAAMQLAAHALSATDKIAVSLWGSTYRTPRTWFNQLVKMMVDSYVAEKGITIFTDGSITPGDGQLAVSIWEIGDHLNDVDFYYGTTKACTSGKVAGADAAGNWTATIPNLTNGVKYYVQAIINAPANYTMIKSGVYAGTPVA